MPARLSEASLKWANVRHKGFSKRTQFYTQTLWPFKRALPVPLVSETLVSVCQSSLLFNC